MKLFLYMLGGSVSLLGGLLLIVAALNAVIDFLGPERVSAAFMMVVVVVFGAALGRALYAASRR